MSEKKPTQPVTTRQVVGDSLFPHFPVRAPMPTGTAAPGPKSGASQTTASGGNGGAKDKA